jgi:hypothetical protein
MRALPFAAMTEASHALKSLYTTSCPPHTIIHPHPMSESKSLEASVTAAAAATAAAGVEPMDVEPSVTAKNPGIDNRSNLPWVEKYRPEK